MSPNDIREVGFGSGSTSFAAMKNIFFQNEIKQHLLYVDIDKFEMYMSSLCNL